MFAASGAGMALTGVLVFAQRHVWVFPPAEQDVGAVTLAELDAA